MSIHAFRSLLHTPQYGQDNRVSWLGNLLVGLSRYGEVRAVLGLPMGHQALLAESDLPYYSQHWVNTRMRTCESHSSNLERLWTEVLTHKVDPSGMWPVSVELCALVCDCWGIRGWALPFWCFLQAVSSTMSAVGTAAAVFKCSLEDMPAPCFLSQMWGGLSAALSCVGFPARAVWYMHVWTWQHFSLPPCKLSWVSVPCNFT